MLMFFVYCSLRCAPPTQSISVPFFFPPFCFSFFSSFSARTSKRKKENTTQEEIALSFSAPLLMDTFFGGRIYLCGLVFFLSIFNPHMSLCYPRRKRSNSGLQPTLKPFLSSQLARYPINPPLGSSVFNTHSLFFILLFFYYPINQLHVHIHT